MWMQIQSWLFVDATDKNIDNDFAQFFLNKITLQSYILNIFFFFTIALKVTTALVQY